MLPWHLQNNLNPNIKGFRFILWMLVVCTFNSTQFLWLCPKLTRLQLHSVSSPASLAAGYGCERKTWWPSSPAGCSPASGRVRGNARSLLLQGPVAQGGSSLDESLLLHAPLLTTGASIHHASLWEPAVRTVPYLPQDETYCHAVTWFWWSRFLL